MANIVESLMDKIKIPEKLELSQADRQLLQKLAETVDELKNKDYVTAQELSKSEQRLLSKLREAWKDDMNTAIGSIPAPEAVQAPEVKVDLSELKHFISEKSEQESYHIRALVEEKNNSMSAKLQSIHSSMKDEEILNMLPAVLTQLSDTEHTLRKQLRTVKIMMGFTIWISIMTLAAMVAQALGYL